jgi:ribonuclease HII
MLYMPPKPDFSFEDQYTGTICGIDEVGRGPLAGPVVAAAVVIRRDAMPQDILAQINDSKKLTAQKRAYLFDKIHEFADVSIAECSVAEIDKINILQASLRAMALAFKGLSVRPAVALVDGNQPPKLSCTVKTIVKGDSLSLSIAAASVVAKHYRDNLMMSIANDFPHYGWETNAGYGTAHHLKALQIHGVTIHHRRSFEPVARRLKLI